MSEEEYWIIPSVCTYRDFTKENFDESIGDKFFTNYKCDQKNDELTGKKNDMSCKRQKSTTSLDSGVEDKDSAGRYSTESNSSNSEHSSSSDSTRNYRKQSTEELLIRLNKIRKQNESIDVKPKPKLQLRHTHINKTANTSIPLEVYPSLDSPLGIRRTSRILSVPDDKMQYKYFDSVPILPTRRSYSIEKTPVLTKSNILRSNSLRSSNNGMSKFCRSKSPSSRKTTTPVVVAAKTLSSKISSLFSSTRRSCGGRATSEPPKQSRKSKTIIESQVSNVKFTKTNTNTNNKNNYSKEQVKGKLSKEKIVNIIEKLSHIKK